MAEDGDTVGKELDLGERVGSEEKRGRAALQEFGFQKMAEG